MSGPARLPQYPGSAWRGAFGHALKKTVCIVRDTPCAGCMLKSSCAYSYIFETPPPPAAEKMRKYAAAPHPFALRFPVGELRENECYPIDLLVFGHGQRFFPYLVHALQKAGQDGIGSARQVFTLVNIEQRLPNDRTETVYRAGQLSSRGQSSLDQLPPRPERVELRLHTPMRIKQHGHHLTPETFAFGPLFGNLLRRISMLSYFHTDTPLTTDFAGLTRQAKTVAFIDKNLRWFDWTRYSSRQQTEMQMGGVIGSVELDLRGLDAFWPYLWLGQWTHAGKGASMGLGHYRLEAASLPDREKGEK